ncbi:MAG: hypothetical protein E7G28_13000 [Cutibacterium avidum]|nr:hypothetical protein [Cutibacterium avidum]MDU3750035.1 hypothetical protein [Cutibacterium avidum]
MPYLDAASVRDEVHKSPESHFLTPEQAAAVAALSDEEIESWVHEVAAGDDAFWAAHDGLRSDVIARLAEVIAGREDNDGSAPSETPQDGDDLTLDRVVVDQPTPAAGSFHDPAVGGLAARVAHTESPTDPPLIDWLTAHQNDERVQHAVESLLGRLRAMSGVLHHAVPARTRHDWQNEFLAATAVLLEGQATPDGDRIADWLADHENDHNVWCAVNRFCDELGDLSRRPNRPVIPTGFWPQITHQLAAIVYHRPATFEGVRRILLDPLYDDIAAERNRNGVRHFGPDAAFFAGSGGDETLMRALIDAGWQIGTEKASYWYTMTHPATGETLTYTEGDIELGDRITDR